MALPANAERAPRQQPTHDGRHGHAAAVVADAGQQSRRQLVQVRQMIARHRDQTAPVILEGNTGELRIYFMYGAIVVLHIAQCGRRCKHAACTEHQPPARVEAEIAQQLPGVGGGLAVGQNRAAQLGGNRCGGNLQRRHRDQRAAQLVVEVAGVGIGGKDHAWRREAALRGLDAPGAAQAREPQCGTLGVNACPGTQGRIGKSAHVRERLHRAAAAVEQTTTVARRAGQLQHLAAREQIQWHAAAPPLFRAPRQARQRRLGGRRLQPTGALGLALNAETGDQLEDDIGSRRSGGNQPPAGVGTQHGFHGVRIVLDTRDHLTAVDTGSTFADVGGLQHHDILAAFGQMQCCRQSGVTCADHCDLGALRAE
jgi:hypothetical protein